MSMAGVFTQAAVCNDDQIGISGPHLADGLLHNAAVGIGLAARRVFFCRNAEQNDAVDANGHSPFYFLQQMIQGILVDPRHRVDGVDLVFSLNHKNRIN